MFADLSGRRPRRMRLIGLVAGGLLLTCLAVMAVGLLGGPEASFIPWSTRDAASHAPHPAVTRGIGASASPAPAPGVVPLPRATPSARAGTASAAGSAMITPTLAVTNRASKTPPGRNRTASPRPSKRSAV